MRRIAIIADDVTGALDASAKLLVNGFRADVCVDSAAYRKERSDADVIGISTNTRSVSPEEARTRIRQLLSRAEMPADAFWYKKVDSTLRGNTGAEIETMLAALSFDAAVLCSAFPETGRIIRGGSVIAAFADGSSVTRPVDEIVSATADIPVCRIPLSIVREGTDALQKAIGGAAEDGRRLIVPDAETEEDLSVIAGAVTACGKRILPCGSAGLVKHLYRPDRRTPGGIKTEKNGTADATQEVLAVIGSLSPATVRQVGYYCQTEKECTFALRTDGFDDEKGMAEAAGALKASIASAGCPVKILTTDRVCESRPEAVAHNISNPDIAAALAQIAAEVIRETGIRAVFLTGGETAESFLRRLDVSLVHLKEEVLPGLVSVYFTLSDGTRMLALAKSGSFGGEDILRTVFSYLSRTVIG